MTEQTDFRVGGGGGGGGGGRGRGNLFLSSLSGSHMASNNKKKMDGIFKKKRLNPSRYMYTHTQTLLALILLMSADNASQTVTLNSKGITG